jgi:hypothetical protein
VAEALGRGDLETDALDEAHLLAAAAHEVEHARDSAHGPVSPF